jgi:hypothetical protein
MYQASETASSTKAPAWGICWDAGAGADAGSHVVQQEQASRPGALCYQESGGRISGWWRHPIVKWRRPQPEGSPAGASARTDVRSAAQAPTSTDAKRTLYHPDDFSRNSADGGEVYENFDVSRLLAGSGILLSVEGFQKVTNRNPSGRSGRALGLVETVPKRDRQRLSIATNFPFPRRGTALVHRNMVSGTRRFRRLVVQRQFACPAGVNGGDRLIVV